MTAPDASVPIEISIVIPIRFAAQTVVPTIQALLEQCRNRAAEVIGVVSAEDPTLEVLRAIAGHPQLRLIELPGRRSVPQLRGEGVHAASGRLIAISEDHCLFSQGWVAGFIEQHAVREIAAVGGPVENGRHASVLDWAIYFSRYLGSMPPVGLGSTRALPGNNACYKREALEAVASLFREGFWEHEVNDELAARGYLLWVEPTLVVTHNKPYRFLPYLALRYRHARCYGGRIAKTLSGGARVRRAILSPLIPALMVLRAVLTIRRKRRRLKEFLLAFPALLLCYLVWFWGELVGYLRGAGGVCSETD